MKIPNICDYCDEEKEDLIADGNPYGKNLYYCRNCEDRLADKEPNYDYETAEESCQKAFKQKLELK